MSIFGRRTILVVDDNGHMREILRRILTAFGAGRLIEAENALTAYLVMCSEAIDLVILDHFLKERTATDFIGLLRRDAACPNRTTPVVVLTALPAHARAAGVIEAGAQAVVPKPVSPRVLWEELATVLEGDEADDEGMTGTGGEGRAAVDVASGTGLMLRL